MSLDLAPVSLSTPTGILEPVRIVIADDTLEVTDRDGNILATDAVQSHTSGRRTTTIYGGAGTYVARTLCNCGSHQRALRAEWEYGTDVPRRTGT